MYDTPAKILSSAYVGLGSPEPEILQQSELAQVMWRKISYYYEGARQSDQNLTSKLSPEFTLANHECSVDLQALTDDDIIVPLWCERKLFDYAANNPVWCFVPTVNMDILPERRYQEIIAVGYHGENPNDLIAEFSVYGADMVEPYNRFRIWYAPKSAYSQNINEAINIPVNLTTIITIDTQIAAIPQMILNASKYIDKRPELGARVEAWKVLLASLTVEKAEWKEWWETWRKQSRSYHRAVNHNDVLRTSGANIRRNGSGWGGF